MPEEYPWPSAAFYLSADTHWSFLTHFGTAKIVRCLSKPGRRKKQAIESLQKAFELGFKNLKWLETEPDLKNIRREKGYKELVEQLKKR